MHFGYDVQPAEAAEAAEADGGVMVAEADSDEIVHEQPAALLLVLPCMPMHL